MKKSKKLVSSKKVIALGLCGTILSTPVANAGFLEDFYTSAGSAVNVTPAQAYQTETMGVLTSGRLVFRAPQRNFAPFHATPASLKFGCGGIDVFLGAFGMANRQQFVQFLRNIGQNASGLAFKVALQAMAPELESKIQEMATFINDWNKHFGNSCSAAKALMDAASSKWMKETVQNAKLNMVGTGASSDYSEASDEVDTDGETAINNAPAQLNSDGKTIMAPELNILWSAMNSGNMGLDRSEKELIMALIGTTVFRKSGSSGDAVLEPVPYSAKIDVASLVGDPLNSTSTLNGYGCPDDDKCLTVTDSPKNEKSFSRMVFERADRLRQAIIDKVPPDAADIKLLTVTTSIPIYKIVQFASLPNRSYIGQDLLEQYSQAVGWEIASYYIEDISRNLEKMLTVARQQGSSQERVDAIDKIKERLVVLRREMKLERDEIYQKLIKSGSLIQQIEHLERALYGNLSSQLAANLKFGR